MGEQSSGDGLEASRHCAALLCLPPTASPAAPSPQAGALRQAYAAVVADRRRGVIGARTLGQRLRACEQAQVKTCDSSMGACWVQGRLLLCSCSAWQQAPVLLAALCCQSRNAAGPHLHRRCLWCPRSAGGCGLPVPVDRQLARAPRLFSLLVAWEGRHHEAADVIAATLAALDEQVRQPVCGGSWGPAASLALGRHSEQLPCPRR